MFRPRTSSSGDGREKCKTKAVFVFTEVSFVKEISHDKELQYKSIIWLGTAEILFLTPMVASPTKSIFGQRMFSF